MACSSFPHWTKPRQHIPLLEPVTAGGDFAVPTQKGWDPEMGKLPNPALPAGDCSPCCCLPLLTPQHCGLWRCLHNPARDVAHQCSGSLQPAL